MARVTCKASVRFKGFTRGLIRILVGVQRVAERTQIPSEIVITSANDGKHSKRPRSRHYSNEAIDVRSKTFQSGAARAEFVRRLRKELGTSFYIVYEYHGTANAHFHIQVRKGAWYVGALCHHR